MKSKKGDASPEGMSAGLLILIAFVVLVFIGMIYFATRASDAVGNIPEEVEAIIVACNADFSTNFYCNQMRKIADEKYVTCDYAAESEGLVTIKEYKTRNLECKKDGIDKARIGIWKKKCEDKVYKNDTVLNGVSCANRKLDLATPKDVTDAAAALKVIEEEKAAAEAECKKLGGAPYTGTVCLTGKTEVTAVAVKGKLGEGILCCKLA